LLEEIEVSIVSDKVIAEVHQRFMSIAGPTDVITFGHGEIVISAETAARQAGEFGERLEVELGLYVIHGILHLNGYDDLEEGVAAGMRKRQGEILGRVLRVVNAPA
jgi:probable rRNA maturation factor